MRDSLAAELPVASAGIERGDAAVAMSAAASPPIEGAPAIKIFPAPKREGLWSYVLHAGSSVLQQGLFAGASFLTSLLLARWLAPASYGAYALAYSFYLLLLVAYSALFFEPMMVFGAGRYAEKFPAYVRRLVAAHFVFLLPASALIALAAPLVGRFYGRESQSAFLALTLVAPFLLMVWLCRGAFYAQLKPHAGTAAAAGYFVMLLVILFALRRAGVVTPVTAFVGMAAGSATVAAAALWGFRRGKARSGAGAECAMSDVLSNHWRYGRWATLTGLASWTPANLFYLILASRYGLASTAALRALMNLMYPLLNGLCALVLMLMPMLVRQLSRDGLHRMKRTIFELTAVFIPTAALYFVLLAIFGLRILHFLYAGRYSGISYRAILATGLLPVTAGLVGVFGAALRALERPHLVFWACLASTLVALSAGIPMTLRYGVPGACCALVLNDLPAIAVLAVFLARCKEAEKVIG